MRFLFILIGLVYLVIIVLAISLYLSRSHRNYWIRVIVDLKPCPFGHRRYHISRSRGDDDSIEGIFSYSLYGNYQHYSKNLLISLDRIRERKPTWQGWVYTAEDIPIELEELIISKGGRIIVMRCEDGSLPLGHEGAVWRYLPLAQDKPFLCLDSDDILSEYMLDQLDQWLASDQPFCSLNYYTFLLPFTARAWGSRRRQYPQIEEEINRYCEYWFGFDEAFLRQVIWPIAQVRGCWNGDICRLDLWLMTLIILIIGGMVVSLYYVYSLTEYPKS